MAEAVTGSRAKTSMHIMQVTVDTCSCSGLSVYAAPRCNLFGRKCATIWQFCWQNRKDIFWDWGRFCLGNGSGGRRRAANSTLENAEACFAKPLLRTVVVISYRDGCSMEPFAWFDAWVLRSSLCITFCDGVWTVRPVAIRRCLPGSPCSCQSETCGSWRGTMPWLAGVDQSHIFIIRLLSLSGVQK